MGVGLAVLQGKPLEPRGEPAVATPTALRLDTSSSGNGRPVEPGVLLVLLTMSLLAAMWIWVVVGGARGNIKMDRQPDGRFGMSPTMRKTGLLVLGTGLILVVGGAYLLATGDASGFLVLGLVATASIVVAVAWRFSPYRPRARGGR